MLPTPAKHTTTTVTVTTNEGLVDVSLKEFINADFLSRCAEDVQMLKDYVEIHVGPITISAVPLFSPDGTDSSMLSFLAEYCLLGILSWPVGELHRKNLLVAFCIAKGMLGMTIVPEQIKKFARNKWAPDVPNGILVACSNCSIDVKKYPTLEKNIKKLRMLWDAMKEGEKIQPIVQNV